MATKKRTTAKQNAAPETPKAETPPATPPANVEKKEPSVLAELADQLRCRPSQLYQLLKTTVFKNCRRDEEFQMACMVAREYKLNPVLKEIYAFPAQNGVVPIVSVDGWNRIMNSHPMYDGIEFVYDGTLDVDEAGEYTGRGTLSCTAKIHRKDRRNPVCVTEFYEECYRDTDPWNAMPRRMLRWKALIQCARVAFGFAGIYDFDEGNDILSHDGKRVTKDGNIVDVDAVEIARDEDKPVDFVYEDEPDPTEDKGEPVAKVVDAEVVEPAADESDVDDPKGDFGLGDDKDDTEDDADESEEGGAKDGDDDFPW